MKQKRYPRYVALFLTAMLAATLTSSCGNNQSETNSQAKNSTVSGNNDGSLEPITFDIFINGMTNDWNGWGNDPVTQKITEETGVSLNVTTATTTDNSQINAMVASGQLPDFVAYGLDAPIRSTLWKQGFLYPLNELIDEYRPEMWDVIPKDMDKIYQEEDGNFYMFVRYYSDVDKIAEIPGTLATISGFTLDDDVYQEIGSPELKTLEQYREVLKTVKEKYPDIIYPAYDGFANTPQDLRNMAQLINRAYGGTHVNSIAEDDTVHLNFRDETYKKAILYINSLYRDGLFNPENFTITKDEQVEQIYSQGKVFSSWGQPFLAYKWNPRDDGPQIPFNPPTDDGVKMTLNSVLTTTGDQGTSITRNCKDPERAIQFFEYYLSEEGQLLMYHGIEGKDYEMVDNMPKNIGEKAELWSTDFAKMQKDLGILNYNVCFATPNWADMMYYYWLNSDNVTNKLDAEVNNQLAVDERINGLIKVPSDSDFKVIETKIFELWKTSLPKMYLADSEEKCLSAYEDFINQAEAMGLKDLENEYTNIYKDWQEKLK